MRKKINNVSNWLKKASALFLVLSVALILVTPVYSATGGAVAASSDWQVTVQNKLETAKIGVFKFSKFVGVSLAEYGRNTVKMVEFFGASLGGQMNNLGLDLKNGAKKISTGSETLGKQMGDYVGAVVGLGATAASRLNSAANQITELPRQTVQSIGAAGSFVGRGFQATSSKLQSINIGRELQVISSKLQDLAGRVSDLAIDLGRGLQEQSVEISAKLASLAKSEEPVAEVAPVSAPAPGGDIGKTIIVGPKPAEPAPITNPKTVAKKLTETNAAPSVKTIIEKQVSTVVRTNDLSRAEAEKIISELIVKNRIITADKDGVATLTGLRVASLVDFTGADIKGLPQTAAAPAANPTAPPPLPNVYNTFISSSPVSIQPVVGTIGGVTTDFSVGRNLTVSQDATVASTLTIATVANPAGNLVVNGAASVSGATTLAAATLSGLLTANSGATIGDTSADTLTINAITSSTAPISIIASSSGAMLYVKNTASVSSTDPHPALRIAGSVADKNLDLFVDENGNAKIRTTAGGGGNIYMHPDGGSVYLQTNLIVGSSGNATIQASGRANFSYDPVVGAPSLWLSTSSTYPTYKTYIAIDPAETVSFDRFLHFSHGNNDRLILGYDGDLLLNASSTYSGNLFTIRKEGSSRFYVDNSGNVNASGTLSAAAMSIAGNLNPASDNLYDIGSSSTQWRYGNFQGGLLVADGTTTSTLSNNSLILGQTSGSNVGKFYVDSSGNVKTSGSLLTYGNVTSTGNLYALSGTASTSILNGSSLTLGQGANYNSGMFSVSSNGNVSASGTMYAYGVLTVKDRINFNDALTATFVGYQAGNSNTGGNNSAFGYQALYANGTGQYNTAAGYFSLKANTTGNQNSSFGWQALQSNIEGSYNTAIGLSTLESNTNVTGFNTALGARALQYGTSGVAYNTAVGNLALNLSGQSANANNNVAVGYKALYSAGQSVDSSNNIALGYQAGDALTSGSNNIIIGYDVDFPVVASNNMLDIGNLIYATGINGTGTTTSTGNLGIGTYGPSDKLTVYGRVSAINGASTSTLREDALIINQTSATYNLGRFYVDSSGNVNVSGSLLTYGNVTSTGLLYALAGITSTGHLLPATDNLYDIGSSSTQWRYGNFQGGLLVADGTTTSTLSNNSLILGQTSGSNVGKFYVDSSGNVNASGSLLTYGNVTSTGLLYALAGITSTGHLLPATDNLYDIGSSSTQWRYGNFQGGLLVADGTTTSTLSNNSLILGQTSGSNVGKFYVDTSGNTSVSGTLTVFGSYTAPARLTIDTNGLFSTASSTLLATSTLDYQSFSLGNNSFTSSANGTTTISSLETSNLNFPDDAGAVGWVNLQITTTTANIENSFTASINDYPALMIYGLSNTAGTAGNIGVMFASSTAPWADFDVNNRFTIASSTGNTNTSGTLRVWGGASTGGLLVSSSNTTTTLTSYVSGNGVGAFVLDTNTLFAPASSTVLLSVRNGGNKVFSVSNDGYVASTGTFNANVASSGIGDVAEYVNLIPNESVEPGDVLVVSKDTPNKYKKSTTAYTKEIAGVVSDTGAFIIGASGEGRAPLALAGLVRVKVTIENGPIGVGDYLVSASQPGKAMKYDTANPQAAGLVGMALEPATADGRITIMVNKGLLDGAAVTNLNVTENVNGQLVQNNDLNLGGFSIYNVKAITGANGLWSIDEEGKMVAINIKVDKAQAKQLVIEKDNAANKSTVGEAKILAGQTSALVANEMVSSSGKIFITFRNNPKAFWWISRQEDGLFEVSLSQSASEDVVFDYWLVGVVSPVILPPTGGTPTSDVGATTESLPPPVAPSVVEPPPAEVPPVVEPPATEPPLTSSDVTPTDSVGATENVIPTQVEESSPATPTP